MIHNPPQQVSRPTINRVSDVMAHTNRYAFHGLSRLAKDARVTVAAISRIIHGKRNPSFQMVVQITTALEAALGRRIDPRDLFAAAGNFLTLFACEVAGCPGCLPHNVVDEFGKVARAFEGVAPGRWVSSKFPRGFQSANSQS